MSGINLDNITNSDSITFSTSPFQRDTNQNDYLVTDTFNSTSYLNVSFIDQNDTSDSTTIQNTFSIASNILTLTYGSSTGYDKTGVSNRYMHGRNKFISANLTSGNSNTPLFISRFTSISDFVLSYIDNNNSTIAFQTWNGSGTTTSDRAVIPGPYSTATNYRMVLKTFENLTFFAVIDPSTLKLMRSRTTYSSIALAKTGSRNGFGLGSGTTGFSNLTTKDMNNYVNVVCIGDSNTDDGGTVISNVGNNYVQLLNNKFIDKNISFTNQGISGNNTYDILNRMPSLIASYVPGARNIATFLIGTNDAGETNSRTWDFTTSCNNIVSIAAQLKNANFEVWLCTYPPRNQNPASGGLLQAIMNTQNLRVSQLNGFIRSLSSSKTVDRIIPLDLLFMDPTAAVAGTGTTVYQNSSSTLVDQANTGISYIHFIAGGHLVIANQITLFLEKSWNQNTPVQNLNITNGINIYGKNNNIIPSSINSNTATGALTVNGSIALTNSTTNYANTIMWTAGNNAEPAGPNTTRSIGSKLVLWTGLSSTNTDYAIGIGAASMWYQVDVTAVHNWYTGGFKIGNWNNTSLTINNGTASSSTTTGALVVAGGLGVGGALYAAGNIYSNGVLLTAGATYTQGTNILISSNVISTVTNPTFSGVTTISNVTASTTSSNGALVVSGGAGIGGNLNVGGTSTLNGNTSVSGSNTFTVGTGQVTFNNTTSASGLYNSAAIVSLGSIGISKNITVGDNSASTLYRSFFYQPVAFVPDSVGATAINMDGLIAQIGFGGLFNTNTTGTIATASIFYFSPGLGLAAASATTITNSATLRIAAPIVASTNVTITNNWAMYIDTGRVFIGNTTATTSSSTGTLLVSGGISSSNTTNSVSSTNGGTFTTAGGAAIAKDVYIGGNLNVTGTFSSALGVPGSRTTSVIANTVTVTVNNQILTTNGTNNMFAATFSCTPTAANTLTSFVTNLPNRTSNSTFVYEIIATIQGFNGTINISNCLCFAVTGTTNFQIQFTSIDNTNVHYIQVRANYISN